MSDECRTKISRKTRDNAPRQRRLLIAVGIGLVAITWIVFWQVKRIEFVNLDDGAYVTENPYVSAGLSLENVAWAFTTAATSNWHPLTWLSLMLDVQVFGRNSGAMHLTSLLFHTANVVLLFAVLRLLTGSLWRSALVSALFAVHPLHVESVAWVSERKDVLSTFFGFLAIWSYARYATNEHRKWFLACGVLWICSLMAKQMLVTLPFLLLLLDYWPLDRYTYVPLVGIFVAFAWLLPAPAPANGWRAWGVPAAAGGAIVVLAAIAWRQVDTWRDSERLYANAADVTHGNAFAESNLGYAVFLKGRHDEAFRHYQQALEINPKSVSAMNNLGILMRELGRRDQALEFHRRALAVDPRGTRTLRHLGRVLFEMGRNDEALEHFEQAIRIDPLDLDAHGGRGNIFLATGRPNEALEEFRVAVQIGPRSAMAYNSLGAVLAELGRVDEAVASYRCAIRLDPRLAPARANLGTLLHDQGNFEGALANFQRAFELDPVNEGLRQNLAAEFVNVGTQRASQGMLALAIDDFRNALHFAPGHLDANYRLARALGQNRQLKEAVDFFEKTLALKSDIPDVHVDYAVVLDELGLRDTALEHVREALRLRPDFQPAKRALQRGMQNR